MPGRISPDDVQALRERADIGAIVGDHTALRRSGTKLTGLCPFHSEKTPSFTVDPGLGLFHCFGCGVGGTVYDFLMRIEALTFPEAVERLARITGYELRYEQLSPGARKALGRRTRLAQALAEAAAFYRAALADDAAAAPARAYLAGRGIDADEAARFGLGWAPDSWDTLSRHLAAQGFEQRELIDAGLATQGQRGLVDRFRGRVLFPITDRSGSDVVAFGGRIVPGVELRTAPRDATPPKYINSPETEIYRKHEVLYGLAWARAEIQRRGAALVVEGYMDVLGLHLAGVRHAVATCGTALTADHVRQLEQFAPRIVLALDADTAGYAAADRARQIAAEAGVRDVGVLPLPPGQDPADLAALGEEAVAQALANVRTAVEFQIEHVLRTASAETPEAQVEAYRATFPLLAKLPDRALRYRYVRDLVAPAVRLSADLIERELDDAVARDGADGGRAARARPAPNARLGDVVGPPPKDPQLLLEREVLLAALRRPDLLPEAWADVVEEDFRAPMSRQLFAALRSAWGDPAAASAPRGDLDALLDALPDDELRGRVRALALSESTVESEAVRVEMLVADLRRRALERQVEEVRGELARLNATTDADRRRALLGELAELDRRRRAVLVGVDG